MDKLQKQGSQQISSIPFWTNIVKFSNVIELDYTTARKGMQISQMTNGIGKKEGIAILTKVIEGLNESISVGNKMSPTAVMETAMIVNKKYWHIKVEQLAHFCLECKSGTYGAFQRFDQPTFFEALDKYLNQADIDREQKYEEFKNNDYEQRDETDLEGIQGLAKKLESNK